MLVSLFKFLDGADRLLFSNAFGDPRRGFFRNLPGIARRGPVGRLAGTFAGEFGADRNLYRPVSRRNGGTDLKLLIFFNRVLDLALQFHPLRGLQIALLFPGNLFFPGK